MKISAEINKSELPGWYIKQWSEAHEMNPRELMPDVRELLRRSILTLAAVPACRGPQSPQNPLANRMIHDAVEAYGYQPPAVRLFTPSPRDVSLYLEVLEMLSWYQREYGSTKVKVFVSWAFDLPFRIIAWQIKRSEDTVQRWRDAVALTIAEKYTAPLKKMLEGACGECGAGVQNENKMGEATVKRDVEPKNPTIWLASDSRPQSGAHLIPGSPAELDRKKTVKRLERNARREARRKRA